MTTTNYNINEKPFVSFQYRKDSGELDVFEAARYFSGDVDSVGFGIERFADGHAQKRNSFEIPTQQAALQLQPPQKNTEIQHRNKKCKSGSSPAANGTDWFSENKWVMMINNRSNGEKWRFQRDVGGKVEVDDVESDSSSDLFELKNIGSIDDALSELLPAYGTADMKVLGNGSAALIC
ncbi:hypothetical protein J5N97_028647 [Dioscorea zingiberensis]|uniref:Uncharacterized protein n=1 Tax=Dioscorea zingiberensis TaxID=325984 RepID=A0A9D5H514_9LILI|nr:hypothetical protein J5N97_028647 [Dioscorea zingiberensis]